MALLTWVYPHVTSICEIPAQGKCSLNDGSSFTGIAPLWSCADNMLQTGCDGTDKAESSHGSFTPNPETMSTAAS